MVMMGFFALHLFPFWGSILNMAKLFLVYVNPVENLLNVGTIRAFSGSLTSKGGRIYDKFIAIPYPYDVFKRIKELTVDIKTDWNYALRPEKNQDTGLSMSRIEIVINEIDQDMHREVFKNAEEFDAYFSG